MRLPHRDSTFTRITKRGIARYFALRFGLMMALAVVLAACEPQASPLPAVLPPTPTPIPVPTLPPPLRYALTASTGGFVTEIDKIRATGLVDQLSDNNTDENVIAGYDVVATFGLVDGWDESPVFPHVALVINTNAAPMNNRLIIDTLTHSLKPAEITDALQISGAAANALTGDDTATLKTALANAGYPDGFDLVLAEQNLPGTERVAAQLAAANLNITVLPMKAAEAENMYIQKRAHLLLIAWHTAEERAEWVERAGEDNVIDLYTLPISYRVLGDLKIEFTSDGFPIAAR